MLQISFDLSRIAGLQRQLATSGLSADARLGGRILELREALEKAAGALSKSQARAAAKGMALQDARLETVSQGILLHLKSGLVPKKAAALLQGLQTPVATLLPEARATGSVRTNWRRLDPESYYSVLLPGSPPEKKWAGLETLVIYFDALTELRVMWIGPKADRPGAVSRISYETSGFIAWDSVHPAYGAALAKRIQADNIDE